MKNKMLILVLNVALLSCTSARESAGVKDSLKATELLPYGRSVLTGNSLELISSAAHFGFSFEGNQCILYASLAPGAGHNYLQYELDGVYQKRFKISKDAAPVAITAATGGRHTVWIYKATEATTGPVFIDKIEGGKLKPLAPSTAPLIEFIGNSITCGAAADASEVPCGTGEYHDQHNAYYAYGPRVARMLGANFILSSVSGIGIYRTWNKEAPSMPQVYEKADFGTGSSRYWDFATHTPRVVSIALGTNDLSNGDGSTPRTAFDSARFVNAYIGFVQLVKSKYPSAQIALLNSPMVQGGRNIILQHCLGAVKARIDSLYPSGRPVALFFFNPMIAGGCTGHPSVDDHAVLASELMPFLKKLMGL